MLEYFNKTEIEKLRKDNDIIWSYIHLTDKQIGELFIIQRINAIATMLTAIILIMHMVK